MDKNTISMMNGVKSQERKSRPTGEEVEGDLETFSQMLGDRTAKLEEEEEKSSQQNEEIYSEKEEKKKAEGQDRLKRSEMTKSGALLSQKGELYKLGLKDPSSLSLSQKSTLGMETMAGEAGAALSQQGPKTGDTAEGKLATREVAQKQATSAEVKGRKKMDAETPSKGAPAESGTVKDETGPFVEKKDLSETREAERNLKREEVIQQIIQHVELRNLGSKTELALKLNPEYLGEMKLRLLFEDDKVTAHFDTVSPLVREAILESQDELTDALKKKGVKVGKVNVALVDKVA